MLSFEIGQQANKNNNHENKINRVMITSNFNAYSDFRTFEIKFSKQENDLSSEVYI